MKIRRFDRLGAMTLLLLFLFAAIPVSAGDANALLFGSPRLDGVMDPIYRSSCLLTVRGEGFERWGDGSPAPITAECRVLWDASFLYLCTEVHDPAILTAGREAAAGRENDCVICWFADGDSVFSVQADPFGYVFAAGDGKPTFRMENAICASHCDIEKGVYTLEMALPFAALAPGREIGISLQVNDLSSPGSGTAYAGDVICVQNVFSLSPEPAAAETQLPESGQDIPVPVPPTSDALPLLIAAAAAAVIVIAVLLRRRK